MTFASPAFRDNFYYNGDLWFDIGNSNRHKRATVEEISALLRPDVHKSKKALATSPPKDQVGHWYEAQLVHYGLPPSKDKARAKVRLLEALNSSGLKVPAGIAKMEAELKNEFAAAEKKAKAEYEASQKSANKPESSTASKKRKQSKDSEGTTNININISLGKDGSLNLPDSKPQTKKAKTNPPEEGNKKSVKKTQDPGSSKSPKKPTQSGTNQPSQAKPTAERPRQTNRKKSKTHC